MRDNEHTNMFCIDCKSNLADYASLTFGIYICSECANTHVNFLGMSRSFVKSLFKEPWDEYEIKFMENGGNHPFMLFMHQYGIKCKVVYKKYGHKGCAWWSKRLRAIVDN